MSQQAPPGRASNKNGLLVGGALVVIIASASFVTVQVAHVSGDERPRPKITMPPVVDERQAQAAAAERRAEHVAAEASRRQAERATTQAVIEETKRQEIEALASSPGNYLEWSDPKTFDEGIVQDYRRLTGITVLNKAHYAVTDIAGSVTFTDDQGRPFGTLPFALSGSIPAGDTKVFGPGTLTSSTLKGRPTKLAVSFTHVRVIP